MSKPQKFILSDESENRYGYILKTDGIDTTGFRKNPVMLFNHDYNIVLGRWQDIEIINGQLLATPEFDDADPEALRFKGKIDKGLIQCTSVGFMIKKVKKNEDGVPVVVESELLEASFTPVGANKNARRLYKERGGAVLSAEEVKQLFFNTPNPEHKMKQLKVLVIAKLAELSLNLKVAEDATEEQFAAALAERVKALQDENKALSGKVDAFEKERIETLLAQAQKEGKIEEGQKEQWRKRAEKDFDLVKDSLAAIPKKVDFNREIERKGSEASKGKEDRNKWSYRDWETKDPKGLLSMKREEPEKFNALQSEFYQEVDED